MSRAEVLAKMKAEQAALAGTPAEQEPAATPVAAPVAAPVAVAPPAPVAAPVAAPAPVAATPLPVAVPSLLPADDDTLPLWETSTPQPAPAPAAPAYDVSAVVAQATELADIKRRHEEAMREIAELKKLAAAPAPAPRRSAKDMLAAEQWTSENVDHAVAVDLLDGLSPAIEAMIEERVRAATAPVAEKLQAQEVKSATQRQREFEAQVVQRVPHMQRILDDGRFSVFLSQSMPGAGVPYAEAFNRHVAAQDADGMAWVAQQFAAYTRAGKTSAPVASPSTAVEPPPARSASIQTQAPAADGTMPTLAEFKELQTQAAKRLISREEFSTRFAALQRRAQLAGGSAGVH